MMQLRFCLLLASVLVSAMVSAMKVVVTGAGGRTGSLIYRKLANMPDYELPTGIVHNKKSKNKLVAAGADPARLVVADVRNKEVLESAFEAADQVVLCTSSWPVLRKRSLVKMMFGKVIGKTFPIQLTYKRGSQPYDVDWLGAKNQIDAAKAAGVKQFVLVSSMGVTDPEHRLNDFGKSAKDPNSGNILLWKRKAEEYLIQSGIDYTIIHPGGLTDAVGGERELRFGVDDKLLDEAYKMVPREDVAEVCVQALKCEKAKNRSFDLISFEPGNGVATTDFDGFFACEGNCKYEPSAKMAEISI